MTDNINQIPLMFRAQIEGRCQIQRLIPKSDKPQDAEKWVEEWIESVEEETPQFSLNTQTKSYQMTWRFVTNSGQDEGVIRPVIGANGFPYYPGSSMKGAFKRTCNKEEALKYCGGEINQETQQGILRFHGGYPQDLDWIYHDLVDIVHPQQNWQLKSKNTKERTKGESAFIQISLYQPTVVFGISSNQKLDKKEWERIWEIWENALGKGIGCRVSAGYGQAKLQHHNTLLTVNLKGQGLASQPISKNDELPNGEFRPNLFKAALRGHTLRLFGGVTDAKTAERLTDELWGGIGGKEGAIVGQVGMAFQTDKLKLDQFIYTPKRNPFQMPTYQIQGQLTLLCQQNLSEKQQENLTKLLTKLIQFSFLLGGFGKSWRRIDHRLFYPQYLKNHDKPMIGCHWQFIKPSQKLYIPVNELSDITEFFNNLDRTLKNWLKYKKVELNPNQCPWREAFSSQNVQVWGRIARDELDSQAIHWFHGKYYQDQTIKPSILTGELGKISRMWHRMYPRFIQVDNKLKNTSEYIELLTIFPDDSQQTQQFLEFLNKLSDFSRLI